MQAFCVGKDSMGLSVWCVHVPHTGGTSVGHWLGQRTHQAVHDSVFDLHERGDIGDGVGWAFARVRNPWDRAVTAYHYWCGRIPPKGQMNTAAPNGFREWLARDGEYRLTTGHWSVRNMLEYGGEVGASIARFEDGEAGLREILDPLGLAPPGSLPWHNASRGQVTRSHYSAYYDDASRNRIENLCSWEIEMFGYEFGTS